MEQDAEKLAKEIISQFHNQIYETVPHKELGRFFTTLWEEYKELHPYKEPSITQIGNVEIFDLGDLDLY